MPRDATATAPPVTWLEADLGDTEFIVKEHADGKFTVDSPDRLVLNAEQMAPIAQAFVKLAIEKRWVTRDDFVQAGELAMEGQ